MHIQIEETRPEHVEQAQEVFYQTWLHTYPNEAAGITVDDIEDRWKDRNSAERLERRRSELLKADPNQKYLVAIDGKKVVGVCVATKSAELNKLNAIYVLPEYQGAGIGTMLWNEVRTFFDPSLPVTVGVATYNTSAIQFYEKLGFTDTGRRYSDERFKMNSGAMIPEMEMVLRI
ncbi:MAG: GNAT family N-acetyltransferase [Candidatus Pacebacteria bacterium]|nr:GNAT family N-acetyltransferase [Candidatus Paceibacterota bacterium]